jgi:protein regulator of cytokinesis 1
LTNRLNALARTLGSHFFHQDILTPAVAIAEESDNPTALRDVMPERFSKLEKELVRGKGEVVSRSFLVYLYPADDKFAVEATKPTG